jgi:hypothetical protein
MVRLHTSLLALTFATGLVLASSDDYQRRDDELLERDFDDEEFFQRYDPLDERSDTFEEPEARGLFGGLLKIGEEVGGKVLKGRVGTVVQSAKTAGNLGKSFSKVGEQVGAKVLKGRVGTVVRGAKTAGKLGKSFSKVGEEVGGKVLKFRVGTVVRGAKTAGKLGKSFSKVGEEVGGKVLKGRIGTVVRGAKLAGKLEHQGGRVKKIEKHLKTARKVEKNLRPSKKTTKQLKRVAKEANKANNDYQNNRNQNRANQDLQRARKEVADADRYLPPSHQYHIQGRGLEDDEELSRRDLDVEEVFGREYDLFDERDTFDDLD